MTLKKFTALSALLVSLSAGVQAENAKLELQGQLVLKGSLPKVQPVLVMADAQEWVLLDVPAAVAERHQGRRVVVRGTRVSGASVGSLLPGLAVEGITAQPPLNTGQPAADRAPLATSTSR